MLTPLSQVGKVTSTWGGNKLGKPKVSDKMRLKEIRIITSMKVIS